MRPLLVRANSSADTSMMIVCHVFVVVVVVAGGSGSSSSSSSYSPYSPIPSVGI
jgi:hypothetical protein